MTHPAGPPSQPWPGGPLRGCPRRLRAAPGPGHRAELHSVWAPGMHRVPARGVRRLPVRRLRGGGPPGCAGGHGRRRPPGSRPLVTPVLIGLNVAVFAWTVLTSGSVAANYTAPLFREWALVPVLVAGGEWWRVLTSGFLHFGPIHLLFNMLALWVIGRDVETALGRGRFLAVYLVSLLGGSAAVLLLSPPTANVAGGIGCGVRSHGRAGRTAAPPAVPLGQVGMLIAINLVIAFLIPGISVAGHLGGLVVGAAATAALVYAPGRRASVQAVLLSGIALVLPRCGRAEHGLDGLTAERHVRARWPYPSSRPATVGTYARAVRAHVQVSQARCTCPSQGPQCREGDIHAAVERAADAGQGRRPHAPGVRRGDARPDAAGPRLVGRELPRGRHRRLHGPARGVELPHRPH